MFYYEIAEVDNAQNDEKSANIAEAGIVIVGIIGIIVAIIPIA